MGLLPRSCFLLVVVVLLVPDAFAPDPSTSTGSTESTETTATGATTGATAEPGECTTDICDKSCAGCDVGIQVSDPDNCRNYYVCDGAGGYLLDDPLQCNTGEVFNATQHKCVVGEDCKPCESPPPSSDCVYECVNLEKYPGHIAILTDCQHYYKCEDDTGDIIIPMVCPTETPIFNGKGCEADKTNCCHCRPYCPTDATVGDVVADPLDCRKFYLCTELGSVPTLSSPCPNGQYFDSIMNECSAIVSCITQVQCINVVGPDGCTEPLTCLETGYFARCPNRCTPYYYHCTEANGEYQDVTSCGSGTVFHPDTHNCVTPGSCPYPS